MQPYAPRRIQPLGVLAHHGWQVKRYAIVFGDAAHDPARFETARTLAFAELPADAVTAARPGAAILIEHQGRGVDYLVLAWWDNENELPLRVFVHDAQKPDAAQPAVARSSTPPNRRFVARWRPAGPFESICVWDLEVLWAERNAYVQTVLASPAQSLEAYLRVSCGMAVQVTP